MPPPCRPDECRAYALRIAAAFGFRAWLKEGGTKGSSLVFSHWDSSGFRFLLSFQEGGTVLEVNNAQSKAVVQWISNAPQELWNGRWPSDNATQEVTVRLLRALFCLGYPIESLCAKTGVSVSGHDKIEWALAMKEAGYPMLT